MWDTSAEWQRGRVAAAAAAARRERAATTKVIKGVIEERGAARTDGPRKEKGWERVLRLWAVCAERALQSKVIEKLVLMPRGCLPACWRLPRLLSPAPRKGKEELVAPYSEFTEELNIFIFVNLMRDSQDYCVSIRPGVASLLINLLLLAPLFWLRWGYFYKLACT